MRTHVTYLFDPLCGWCYGASAAIGQLSQHPNLRLELAPTGLFAGGGRVMDAAFAAHVWANDQRIAELTGLPFSEAYRHNVPGRPGSPFDSGIATLALTTVSLCEPQRELETLKALQDGGVDIVFDNLASSLPLIQGGKLKALGVTSLGSDDALPHVPSINSEVPGFNVSTWFGLFAPATLPAADAQKYATAFSKAMHSPAGKAQFQKMGLTPEELTLGGFGSFVRSELGKYEFLIKAAKIHID